ncbi:MAG: hypothetical protein ACYS0H_29090, partial [Planctomycetota bacterium]
MGTPKYRLQNWKNLKKSEKSSEKGLSQSAEPDSAARNRMDKVGLFDQLKGGSERGRTGQAWQWLSKHGVKI